MIKTHVPPGTWLRVLMYRKFGFRKPIEELDTLYRSHAADNYDTSAFVEMLYGS